MDCMILNEYAVFFVKTSVNFVVKKKKPNKELIVQECDAFAVEMCTKACTKKII